MRGIWREEAGGHYIDPFPNPILSINLLFVKSFAKSSTMETHREGTVYVEDEYFVVCELGHGEQLASSYLRDVVYGQEA